MNKDEFKWAESPAAKMLTDALHRAKSEMGLSVRQIGKMLGYKQAVVLSHMANGRAPIPIDRAEAIAGALEMEPAKFLTAVVLQRHPDVDWTLLVKTLHPRKSRSIADHLEAILGRPIDSLCSEQRMVLREVAAYQHPRRRWISIHEIPLIEQIRQEHPSLNAADLSDEEIDAILEELNRAEHRKNP